MSIKQFNGWFSQNSKNQTIIKVVPGIAQQNEEDSMKSALKESLNPLLSVAQLLSAAPFPITALYTTDLNSERKKLFCCSLAQLSWAMVLLVVGCVSFKYKRIWRFNDMELPFITYVLYNLELLWGLINCSVIFVMCQRRRRTYDDIVTRLVQISMVFQRLQNETQLACLRYQFNKFLLTVCVFFTITTIADFIYYQNLVKVALTIGVYFLPNIIQLLSLLQYVYVLMFAYREGRVINDILMPMQFSLQSDLSGSNVTLQILREQHMLLHQLVFKMNQHFGVLIISTIALILTTMSITCLELYQHLNIDDIHFSTSLYMAYAMLWILLQISRLMLILYPNYLVENEVNGNVLS